MDDLFNGFYSIHIMLDLIVNLYGLGPAKPLEKEKSYKNILSQLKDTYSNKNTNDANKN